MRRPQNLKKNLPHSFVIFSVTSNLRGRCFQILWPSHIILTLLSCSPDPVTDSETTKTYFFSTFFKIWSMWFLVQKPKPLIPKRYLKCAIDVLPIRPRPLYITATAIGTEFRSMKYLLEPFFSEICTYSTMW